MTKKLPKVDNPPISDDTETPVTAPQVEVMPRVNLREEITAVFQKMGGVDAMFM